MWNGLLGSSSTLFKRSCRIRITISSTIFTNPWRFTKTTWVNHFHSDWIIKHWFSLAKPTANSSAVPLTPRSIPSPRTAVIKFDYDASEPNELSVLAKEVRRIEIHGESIVTWCLDGSSHPRWKRSIYRWIWLDNHWKTWDKRTWTYTTSLPPTWFFILNTLHWLVCIFRLPKHANAFDNCWFPLYFLCDMFGDEHTRERDSIYLHSYIDMYAFL